MLAALLGDALADTDNSSVQPPVGGGADLTLPTIL